MSMKNSKRKWYEELHEEKTKDIQSERYDDGKTIKQLLDQLFYTTTDQIADVNNKTICEFLIGYR
jgi:hypothetical protein